MSHSQFGRLGYWEGRRAPYPYATKVIHLAAAAECTCSLVWRRGEGCLSFIYATGIGSRMGLGEVPHCLSGSTEKKTRACLQKVRKNKVRSQKVGKAWNAVRCVRVCMRWCMAHAWRRVLSMPVLIWYIEGNVCLKTLCYIEVYGFQETINGNVCSSGKKKKTLY